MIKGVPLNLKLDKPQVLNWASGFQYYTFLDSNKYSHGFGLNHFDWMVGVTSKENVYAVSEDIQTTLNALKDKSFFFHLTYDFKNQLDTILSSNNSRAFDIKPAYIQIPEIIIYSKDDKCYLVELSKTLTKEDRQKLIEQPTYSPFQNTDIQAKWNKEEYAKAFDSCMNYLKNGHIYEINLCQEYSIKEFEMQPEQFFLRLNNQAKAPFSTCMKLDDYYVLSVSPERFILNEGEMLISQPIKGTRPRKENKEEDLKQIEDLKSSIKETSENKMIVDLVRNDLSHFAKKGSVKVDELCEIYSFPNVHQMISTVSCELIDRKYLWSAILKAFPMGSMTGVPKIRCMEIIEELETFSRQSYSGTIGVSFPDYLDSNVLIRTVFYDAKKLEGRCAVGGAITIRSDMEEEFEECLVKINGIVKVLGGNLIID